jgi:Tfp pilus assembly protein PilF
MKRINSYAVALLLAASAVGGCATTGQPVAKGEEDEAAAAKNETAPKPPSTEKIQEAKQQQKAAPKIEGPKISASAKAEFDAAVKKWDTAKASKTGITDCKGLASSFSRISEPALAAQAHFNAGTILEGCGYDKDAESEYHAALSANPAYGPAMANLGGLYYKQNNPTTAKSWFEKAIEADAAHAGAAFANLGAILYQQGKQTGDRATYQQAISNLRRALAIDAYDVQAYSILALVYYTIAENDKSKLDLAELVCKQARDEVEGGKNFPQIYNTLGLIQLRKKNPSRALTFFVQAVELDPKYIDAHLNIGAIGLSTRQYEKAAQSFAAVLKLDPKNFDAAMGMGVAQRGLKKIDEAESWYKKAAELDPHNCAVQYNMGVLYQDYKSDPANANLNTAKDLFSKFRACGSADPKKTADAERRMKDIDDTFAAIEQQKKMEAELKEQQAEMEKQQKAMEEQQKQQEEQMKKQGGAATPAPAPSGGAEKPNK